jgi:N-acetylneuraminic acid mutarotase
MTRNQLPYFLTTALLAAALGCQPDDSSPTGPSVADAPEAAAPDLAVATTGWVTRADMPGGARTSVATAAVTQNGSSVLYVIGGKNGSGSSLGRVQAYHAATNTWTWHPDLPLPLYETNGAVAINGKIYVSGGQVSENTTTNALFMFDPATNRWTQKHDMPEFTSGGMSEEHNGQLYVVTKCEGETCDHLSDTEQPFLFRYDPATDTWTTLASPPVDHRHGAAGFIGGKLYVTGGWFTYPGDSKQLDVYDPATNQWTTRAPLGRKRGYAASLAYNGKLYLIGGYAENAGVVRTTTVYNPATNTWGTGAPLPTARVDIAGTRVVVNNVSRIEVVGGPRPGNNLSYQP